MNSFIFSILAIVILGNLIAFPLVTLFDQTKAFVTRTKPSYYLDKFQNFKWDWWEGAEGTDEQLFRWFIADAICGLIILVVAAFMGAVGTLSWFVGIPLVIGGALYGVRWFMDSKS